MAAPQIAPLPPFFTLADGMTVVFAAINATTGAAVSGVKVNTLSISKDDTVSDAPPLEQPAGQIFLIPGPATV